MTTYSSYDDGQIRESELDYLHRRAKGGFGAVMTAACYVHDSGHAFQGQWACSDDRFLPSLRRTAEAIHTGGSAAILQIHHGGRQCPGRLCGGRAVAPSAIPSERPNAEMPRALDDAEIIELVQAFALAAKRAETAGYDAVEIHGANTYLLQQFVSPHSNRREDAWGQDRLKFTREVVAAVLAAVSPGYPVGYRFSPEEQETPGIRWSNTAALIDLLCSFPLSFLHVSIGNFQQESLNGEFDGTVLRQVLAHLGGRLPLIGVGSIKQGSDAHEVLDQGCAAVALARTAITEPEWPQKVSSGEPLRLTVPAENAAHILTLPEALERRIYDVKGWFDVDEPSAMAQKP